MHFFTMKQEEIWVTERSFSRSEQRGTKPTGSSLHHSYRFVLHQKSAFTLTRRTRTEVTQLRQRKSLLGSKNNRISMSWVYRKSQCLEDRSYRKPIAANNMKDTKELLRIAKQNDSRPVMFSAADLRKNKRCCHVVDERNEESTGDYREAEV